MMTDEIIPAERIQKAIYLIHNHKVILDRDLAILYGIPTKALKQAVRRNPDRFPNDFMFVLDQKEFEIWRSQFVTSIEDRKGLRYAPMAFIGISRDMVRRILRDLQKSEKVECLGRGPGALWRGKRGNTRKKG